MRTEILFTVKASTILNCVITTYLIKIINIIFCNCLVTTLTVLFRRSYLTYKLAKYIGLTPSSLSIYYYLLIRGLSDIEILIMEFRMLLECWCLFTQNLMELSAKILIIITHSYERRHFLYL